MEGLFGTMFKGIFPPTVKPVLEGDLLTIKITESEFVEMVMKGLDERVKNAIKVSLKEGYIEIKVKLI